VLTNASPIGMPEALAAQFTDLVQFGRLQRDWVPLFEGYLAPLLVPTGLLVGVPRPAHPAPARPNATYAGTYKNAYYGPCRWWTRARHSNSGSDLAPQCFA
jgi:hypothetical protein